MIVSLTDYPRSRVPIIMASDRTGGGQPASHLAGIEDRGGGGWDRGCEGRLRLWTILSRESAPGLARSRASVDPRSQSYSAKETGDSEVNQRNLLRFAAVYTVLLDQKTVLFWLLALKI